MSSTDDAYIFLFCEILLHKYHIDGKHVHVSFSYNLSTNKLIGDGDFQIWALKGWSLARLTSAKNHIFTIDVSG